MPAKRCGKPRAVEAPLAAAPVTVAIATHNRAQLLAQALASCRDQTVKPERIIVVDDGSTDDTAQVVEAFAGVPVEYVNVGKIGLGHARNLATALCTTRWLCIHDDDDIMLPNRIRDHVAGLLAGANMSHGGWVNFNERGELDYHPGKPVDEDVIVYVGNAITHGGCCYETAVLREFPYRTDVVGGADFDFAVRAVRSGIRCVHTGSYVLMRRRHGASMSALASDSQAAMRRAVVGAIDFRRSDEEIARRTAAARRVAEFALEPPSLSELQSAIGCFARPMRVVAFAPRLAVPLFEALSGLRAAGFEVELFDADASLAAPIALAGRASVDPGQLGSLDAAFRAQGLNPAMMADGASLFGEPLTGMEFPTEPGSFRIALQSDSLRELELAHRILRGQRSWEWYVAVRRSARSGGQGRYFVLASARFRAGAEAGMQARSPSELAQFITFQTDLAPIFLQPAQPQ